LKRIINIFRLFVCLLRVANNPQNTAAALAIGERLEALGLLKSELKKISDYPECVPVIDQRKLLTNIDLRALNTLPAGSLGQVYSSHMLAHGLEPEFYKKIVIKDDVTFCMMRLRQTHDIWHMITGFDTSVPGELGLQAFMMAQTHSPLAPLLIGARLFAVTLKDPAETRLILEQVSRGWRLGRDSKPLFAVDWEQAWARPLIDLQNQLLAKP